MKKRKEKRLYNICKETLMFIERKNEIPEEQVYALMCGLAFYTGKEKKMPLTYIELQNEISQKWQYREIADLSPEQSFIYGSIFGCIKMMEIKRSYKNIC